MTRLPRGQESLRSTVRPGESAKTMLELARPRAAN